MKQFLRYDLHMGRPGPNAYLLIALAALALVALPFLFWYATWFGRALNDAQLDNTSPTAQAAARAACAGATRRTAVASSERFALVSASAGEAASPNVELRQTAAWIMGQDRAYQPFHEALSRLIHDPVVMVRRNAALGLAAFGDAGARPELSPCCGPSPSCPLPPARCATGSRPASTSIPAPWSPAWAIGGAGAGAGRSARARSRRRGPSRFRPAAGRSRGRPEPRMGSIARACIWSASGATWKMSRHYTHPLPGIPEIVQRQAIQTAQAIESRPPAP